MKILYLAHRIPYPPNKGDKIRSFHEIRCLAKNHEVHLACLVDDPGDLKHTRDLEAFCRRVLAVSLGRVRSRIAGGTSLLRGRAVSTGYFYSPVLQRTLDRWIGSEGYDAAVCFSAPMAEYILRAPAQPPLKVMDFCDVDSDKWRQYASESRFPKRWLYAIESRRLQRYEGRVNRSFDHSLFVSTPEADLFTGLFPGARNIRTVPNGVDHGFFSPSLHGSARTRDPEGPVLLFTGAMDYHPNVDGVAWFAEEMFPAIRSRRPGAVFTIVGSRPAPKVRALGEQPGIRVTGFVEDVRPYYAQADVCVIPLRLARGVQNKVLEAMSMALPVVATSRANQGIRATSGEELIIRDDAAGFREAVLSLLESPAEGFSMGRRARAFVRAHFDWDRNMSGLEACLA